MSVLDAVRQNRLDGLRALRDALADEIDAGPSGDAASQTASLARQLRDVLKDIAELEKLVPSGSVVDDLAAKRTTRRAAAKGAVEATGSDGK